MAEFEAVRLPALDWVTNAFMQACGRVDICMGTARPAMTDLKRGRRLAHARPNIAFSSGLLIFMVVVRGRASTNLTATGT